MYKTMNKLMADEFPEFFGNSYERELMLCAENFFTSPNISSILSTWEREYGTKFDSEEREELTESIKKVLKNDKIYNYLNLRWIFKNPSVHFHVVKKGQKHTILYISPSTPSVLLRLTPQEFEFSEFKFSKNDLENYRFSERYTDHLFDWFMTLCNLSEKFPVTRKSFICY